MTATVPAKEVSQIPAFYQAPIGKKVVMAVTGVILFVFVIGHLIGNLQIFLGPEKLDAYAVALRTMPALLWIARIGLLAAVILHIAAAVQLTALKNTARPSGYAKQTPIASSYASRTMMWSGPILGAFVVYHLLHFTFGAAHPDFRDLAPYHNIVAGFRQIPVALAYIVAMVMLGFHLYHGAWSMFQSLGINHPRYDAALRRFAAIVTGFLVAGNISIPVAVLTGLVK
ncbi:MAG: succinate dehydrogenase cytochrome b subunit [Bryobacteraceae bacterium]